MSNIVAIVGRPNVGKSTFFNRLIQRREAIVDAVSGVTRDRHYGKSDWNGKEFSLIDTGGYVLGSDDVFESEIDKQVELAIEEAEDDLSSPEEVIEVLEEISDVQEEAIDVFSDAVEAVRPVRGNQDPQEWLPITRSTRHVCQGKKSERIICCCSMRLSRTFTHRLAACAS